MDAYDIYEPWIKKADGCGTTLNPPTHLDVPPPHYAAIPITELQEPAAACKPVDINDPASILADLASDLSPPKFWLSVSGFEDLGNNKYRTDFHFNVDLTPHVVPVEPSRVPTVKGWRKAVKESIYKRTASTPAQLAAIVRDHAAVLPRDGPDAEAIIANASSLHGEWVITTDDGERKRELMDEPGQIEIGVDAVLSELRARGTRCGGRKRVEWEFRDVVAVLSPLIRAQRPEWKLSPTSKFLLYIKPCLRIEKTIGSLPMEEQARRWLAVLVVLVSPCLAHFVAPTDVVFFGTFVASVIAACLALRMVAQWTLDATGRLSCDYKVQLSAEDFLKKHTTAIVLAAREGRQNVLLKV
ncbi:hypothetical protein HK101_012060 [Irineochytrium annulatum]|nr:hypothetical protein HK101_012060 [Irineochytrium annulatum]